MSRGRFHARPCVLRSAVLPAPGMGRCVLPGPPMFSGRSPAWPCILRSASVPLWGGSPLPRGFSAALRRRCLSFSVVPYGLFLHHDAPPCPVGPVLPPSGAPSRRFLVRPFVSCPTILSTPGIDCCTLPSFSCLVGASLSGPSSMLGHTFYPGKGPQATAPLGFGLCPLPCPANPSMPRHSLYPGDRLLYPTILLLPGSRFPVPSFFSPGLSTLPFSRTQCPPLHPFLPSAPGHSLCPGTSRPRAFILSGRCFCQLFHLRLAVSSAPEQAGSPFPRSRAALFGAFPRELPFLPPPNKAFPSSYLARHVSAPRACFAPSSFCAVPGACPARACSLCG